MSTASRPIFAERLGQTVHVSPLRLKLQRLAQAYPVSGATCLEEWLIAVANQRGIRVIIRNTPEMFTGPLPDAATLADEALAVGCCQLQCLDQPQMLRLTAQMISRGQLDVRKLLWIAKQERVEPILAELARLALKIAPDHPVWRTIANHYHMLPPLREPILHWTRLAEPVLTRRPGDGTTWRLVA